MPFTSLAYVNLQTANYTLLASDDVVQFNCASGSLTATLLSAALVPVGKRYKVRRANDGFQNNILTINTTSAQTIDGYASGVFKLSPADYIEVVSDGSNWQVTDIKNEVISSYSGTSITWPAIGAAASGWNTKLVDTYNAFDGSQFTAPFTGWYEMNICVVYGTNSSTGARVQARVNGAGAAPYFLALYDSVNTIITAHIQPTMYYLTAGQTIGFTQQGINSGTPSANGNQSIFTIKLVR